MTDRARRPAAAPATPATPGWTFLTNHAHVLRAVAADDRVRVRDLATRVGITERATLRILAELEAGGYLRRERWGRRTHYRVVADAPMRHPMERSLPIATLLRALDRADRRP